MDVLFYDVKLNYYVPIISQQGEVAGKLQVFHEIFIFGMLLIFTVDIRWSSLE